MKKLKMHSKNITKENINKLMDLFPNCITESKDDSGELKRVVDFDLLRQELSVDLVEGADERYRLDWPGKREAMLLANSPIAKTLRPCREESVDFDTTENLFIEGDNLDALKLLQDSYLGKVKMIYIDPPYNTGNDFIYEDDFKSSSDEYLKESNQKDDDGNRLVTNSDSNGRYHSDWLNMMYSRLKLARDLLSSEGVIFISIDKNENVNLKKACGEIFGVGNFLSEFIWDGKSGSEDDKFIRNNHEYIISYAKEINEIKIGFKKKDIKKKDYSYADENGSYKLQLLRKWGDNSKQSDRPNLYYPIKDTEMNLLYPKLPNGEKGCWRWGKSKMEKALNNSLIEFKKNQKGILEAYEKIYFNDSTRHFMKYKSLIVNQGSMASGTNELKAIFNSKLFNNPKPSSLILYLSQIANLKINDLVVDFFAGSSSTAHAVMKQNAEDGGNRKFIMIQIPEPCNEKSEAFKAGYKNIAEISKERIRRAGKQIKEELENSSKQENLLASSKVTTKLDTGFRVLKLDSSNMENTYYSPDEVTQPGFNFKTDNIKDDRSEEDLLFQVLLEWGVDLSLPIDKEKIKNLDVFFVDNNSLAACFVKDGKVTEEFVKELAKKNPMRVVFRDAGFKSDDVKINVEQVFKRLSPETEIRIL